MEQGHHGGGDLDDSTLLTLPPTQTPTTTATEYEPVFALLRRWGGLEAAVIKRTVAEIHMVDPKTGKETGEKLRVDPEKLELTGSKAEILPRVRPIDPKLCEAEQVERALNQR